MLCAMPFPTTRGSDTKKSMMACYAANLEKVDMLVASPMRRAIQTCLIAFSPCVKRGMSVVATPLAQESSYEISDTGSSLPKIREMFPNHVDLDLVHDGWDEKSGEFSNEPSILMERAAKLRRWLKSRDKKEVVVVTHGRFAHFLTGNVNDQGEQTTGWWQDAELRSFEFVQADSGDQGDPAELVEMQETLVKRQTPAGEADGHLEDKD